MGLDLEKVYLPIIHLSKPTKQSKVYLATWPNGDFRIMTSAHNLLQQSIAALQQKRYAEAIQMLEPMARATTAAPTKDIYQAQMWLVRAYQESGRSQQAIALCQQMQQAPVSQVRAWAEKTLPTLMADTPSQPAPVAQEYLPKADSERYLNTGHQALKLQKFADAVTNLEAYCQGTDPSDKNYAQAQMWLVKAYRENNQKMQAIALAQTLLHHEKEYVCIWAKEFLNRFAPEALAVPTPEAAPPEQPEIVGSTKPAQAGKSPSGQASPPGGAPIPKAGRADRKGVKLGMKGVAASLSLASGVTLSLLFGMVLVLTLALLLMVDHENPTLGLGIAVALTIAFNTLIFFLAPVLMDLLQEWLYGTRWIDIAEVNRYSPEAARVIQTVCNQKKISQPRLGLIEDNNPTAFTYGSLPNSARLVVSRGLFKYLDDDETATVYAHELGHIVHWDFAVMTLAATLVQVTYLLYVWIREIGDRFDKGKEQARAAAIAAYMFYILGEYLLLYLSRTREYYADHFAAEITGNPNGLSRSLVKIAYGILEEGKRNTEPSKLLQGTRALGIADPRAASLTGTAYRVAAEPHRVGQVFLWDMFNPWAWWMELNSTHPLTGKRVRALSTYAEQLGIDAEFDMANVIREGKRLNRRKLYGNFTTDILMLWADWLGLGIGLLLGGAIAWFTQDIDQLSISSLLSTIGAGLMGLGIGTLLKMVFMYPDFNRAPATDVLALMSDPYASPLRGRAVKLAGQVIGRGDAGSVTGSDLKMQDATGMIYLRYASRFGPIGNFLFGTSQADGFINQEVTAVGWFRRGVMPWVDLVRLDCASKWNVTSHPRFWLLVKGVLCIVGAMVLPSLA